MPLKTNYVEGDSFGPSDINSTNTQINTNETALGGYSLWTGSQAEYDAIETKSNT